MNEVQARVLLLSAIEPGSGFWSAQLAEFGAIELLDRLMCSSYSVSKGEVISKAIKKYSADELLEKITQANAKLLVPSDSDWPIALNDLAAPPIALVVKGNAEPLGRASLSIVGTRNPTNYGVRVAEDFAAGFVDREWNIVSGGAYGIDSAAHKGALLAEGCTIAVLATGVDINYPAGNARLFAEIQENGALVSEVMPGVTGYPNRFLIRNRIIAALSRATLVVEAAFRSGSLRTARDAAELMRPVMAIPGPISSPTSEGCHRLIGERSAEIVTSVADAVEFVSSIQ